MQTADSISDMTLLSQNSLKKKRQSSEGNDDTFFKEQKS